MVRTRSPPGVARTPFGRLRSPAAHQRYGVAPAETRVRPGHISDLSGRTRIHLPGAATKGHADQGEHGKQAPGDRRDEQALADLRVAVAKLDEVAAGGDRDALQEVVGRQDLPGRTSVDGRAPPGVERRVHEEDRRGPSGGPDANVLWVDLPVRG